MKRRRRRFTQVTRLEPQSPEAHARLGAAYQYLGKNRDAMAAYRQATQLGGNASALANLALLEYRAGRYREAAQGYREATRRDPNNPVGLRNLGDAYRKIGREADARAAYEQGLAVTDRMLAVNAHSAQTLQTRGILLAKLGRVRRGGRGARRGCAPRAERRRRPVRAGGRPADCGQHGGGVHRPRPRRSQRASRRPKRARDDEWARGGPGCPLPPVGGGSLIMSGRRRERTVRPAFINHPRKELSHEWICVWSLLPRFGACASAGGKPR